LNQANELVNQRRKLAHYSLQIAFNHLITPFVGSISKTKVEKTGTEAERVNWYKAPEICGECNAPCSDADMKRCCKLCHYLGNDNRCDECDPVDELGNGERQDEK
jgi:hypothetical protein